MTKKFLTYDGLLYLWGQLKTKFVRIEAGKRLITDAEATKLSGIAEGAQTNIKPDWTAAVGNAAEILNKPAIPSKPADIGAEAAGTAAGLVAAAKKELTDADSHLDGKIVDLGSKIDNLNAERIMNKASVTQGNIATTLATAAATCTTYMQTNYSRAPQNLDALILTITDRADDKVKYVYSASSSGWLDLGLAGAEVADASSAVKGVAKLFQGTGAGTDGSMSQKSVTEELAKKVSAEAGKGLSSNDFSTVEKTKLAALEEMIPIVNSEIDTIVAS